MGSLLPLCSLAGTLLVYVTAPSAGVADSLAIAVAATRLSACVPGSVLPAWAHLLFSAVLAGILVVYVTAPSAEVADSLATALVESQLVACVNIVPGLTSIYTWKVKAELCCDSIVAFIHGHKVCFRLVFKAPPACNHVR
jgi:uncharacterized protein involved in tolerance to divalent cations